MSLEAPHASETRGDSSIDYLLAATRLEPSPLAIPEFSCPATSWQRLAIKRHRQENALRSLRADLAAWRGELRRANHILRVSSDRRARILADAKRRESAAKLEVAAEEVCRTYEALQATICTMDRIPAWER